MSWRLPLPVLYVAYRSLGTLSYYPVPLLRHASSDVSVTPTRATAIWPAVPRLMHIPSPPLDNIRVMVIVWRLRLNIITTALCWVVWHNVHSQQHTHVSSSYRSSRLVLSHWDPYAMRRGGCLELYYCNMVEWSWWDSGLIWRPTGFLQCFDTVGLVIWPVKIVPEMTYNVLSGTSNPLHYYYCSVSNPS